MMQFVFGTSSNI